MTTPSIQITDSIAGYQHHGRMTAGYKVVLNGSPVFVGTFSECAEHGSETFERGAQWIIRDARGLVVA